MCEGPLFQPRILNSSTSTFHFQLVSVFRNPSREGILYFHRLLENAENQSEWMIGEIFVLTLKKCRAIIHTFKLTARADPLSSTQLCKHTDYIPFYIIDH